MRSTPKGASERLIVALDVPTRNEALGLVTELEGLVFFFKIGYPLFIREGLSFIRELITEGKHVFLDLKLYGIDDTITLAVESLLSSGVEFLTIYGAGATVEAAKVGRGTKALPKLLAVLALSSVDVEDQHILAQAEKLMSCEVDGLIASGDSIALLRERFPDVLLVAPGIRVAGTSRDDHKRSCTPAEAIKAGADFLVVGRPIRDASDRRAAANAIIDEIAKCP